MDVRNFSCRGTLIRWVYALVILVHLKLYASLIWYVIVVSVYAYSAARMVSIHFCNWTTQCCMHSHMGVLNRDTSMVGMRLLLLAYALATRILNFCRRMVALVGASSPWSSLLRFS